MNRDEEIDCVLFLDNFIRKDHRMEGSLRSESRKFVQIQDSDDIFVEILFWGSFNNIDCRAERSANRFWHVTG